MKAAILTIASILLGGCLGMPGSVSPVDNFTIDRYLGTWYEIARLDHSFERGLTRVTAEYSLREDGGVRVVNRGFSTRKNQWKTAQGKAFFVGPPDEGYLKVSFFGPFYGSYVIFDLDRENYEYAFVCGPTRSYLWLLARTPEPDRNLISKFVETSRRLGFDTDALLLVDHDITAGQ